MEIKTIEELEYEHADLNDKFFDYDGLKSKKPLWDFQKEKWITINDMKNWLKEEIHRSGASTQILKEFEKATQN